MLPLYGTSFIRKRTEHRFIPDTYRRHCPHVAVVWNIFHPKTDRTPDMAVVGSRPSRTTDYRRSQLPT